MAFKDIDIETVQTHPATHELLDHFKPYLFSVGYAKEHTQAYHWHTGLERIKKENVFSNHGDYWKVNDISGDLIPKEWHPLLVWLCKYTIEF